jgi:hypothetical protein
MRTTRLLLALTALAATGAGLVASGCGDEETVAVAAVGDGCLINTDCNAPLICAFRRCHVECGDNRDCATGQRCVQGDRPYRICQLDDERACAYNSECSGLQVCAVDGQCRDQCEADRDCVPEQVCSTGTCADPAELIDGKLPPVAGPQTTGQPCAYTSECPPDLVCRGGLCNHECLGDADCDGFPCNEARRCERPDAGTVYCVPGFQTVCSCVGSEGVQQCKADGSGYGACSC